MARRVLSDNYQASRVAVCDTINRRCARILLSVLQTLPHGVCPWLQPGSPVVQEAVERSPPDENAEGRGSGLAAHASRRVADANQLLAARADASPLRGSPLLAAREAAARAEQAVSVRVAERGLLWRV